MTAPLSAFNALPADLAVRHLLNCCASPAWAGQVAAGRPYGDLASAAEVSDRVIGGLTWAEVEQALSGHPRIGDQAAGSAVDAAWSRQEQSAVSSAAEDIREQLAIANREYEGKFGHIYLVFASGRSPQELLDEARRRLGNSPTAERLEARNELAKIASLRLTRMFQAAVLA